MHLHRANDGTYCSLLAGGRWRRLPGGEHVASEWGDITLRCACVSNFKGRSVAACGLSCIALEVLLFKKTRRVVFSLSAVAGANEQQARLYVSTLDGTVHAVCADFEADGAATSALRIVASATCNG